MRDLGGFMKVCKDKAFMAGMGEKGQFLEVYRQKYQDFWSVGRLLVTGLGVSGDGGSALRSRKSLGWENFSMNWILSTKCGWKPKVAKLLLLSVQIQLNIRRACSAGSGDETLFLNLRVWLEVSIFLKYCDVTPIL